MCEVCSQNNFWILDGRFFVIVYGKKGFAVSCQTQLSFSPGSKLLIGYAGNKGVHNFFYDCPMRNRINSAE